MFRLKKRDPRKSVRLYGRLRRDYDWIDLRICNLSRKGLMAEAENPPSRGHYIEIRRYDQIMVGRVVWQNGQKFGAVLAHEIDIGAIEKGPRGGEKAERRNYDLREPESQVRIMHSPADWRQIGAIFEKSAVLIFGLIMAGIMLFMAYEASTQPLSGIEQALKP